MPRCIAHFCEKPPAVSYSILESVSKAKFAAGSVVSFKCMEGFVLNTSAKIECLRGGQWKPSPMSIRCIPLRCGEPPSIMNGYAIGSNYSFGAMVAYSCNRGFYIKGEKKSACEATGQWGGPIPSCHPVSCSEPPKVENGFLEVRDWFPSAPGFHRWQGQPTVWLTQKQGCGGKATEEGIYLYMWLIDLVLQQKLAQHCKATLLHFF